MGTPNDRFLTKAREKTELLHREINLLEAQEAGVHRRRLELEKEAADWVRAVELYKGTLDEGEAEQKAQPENGRKKETIADLIARYLSGQPGQTAKVGAIASGLVEVGRFPMENTASGQNYSMTYNALLRNRDRFEKAGTGEWRLTEQAPDSAQMSG